MSIERWLKVYYLSSSHIKLENEEQHSGSQNTDTCHVERARIRSTEEEYRDKYADIVDRRSESGRTEFLICI